MKIVAISMSYNEGPWIYKNLQHIYDLVDELLIFEGTVSPFNDQAAHSIDGTRDEIARFLDDYGIVKIKYWSPEKNNSIRTREHYEAWVKNELLKRSNIEHGDIIWMVDADEFYKPQAVTNIISMFQKNDSLLHVPIEEYQFAYNMNLWFKAGHDGRFMRYIKGSQYSGSQHLITPDGKDLSRENKNGRLPREQSQMYHLCWVKHPLLIKEKVLTFKRPSFTAWYNNCYLRWPINSKLAYNNNRILSRPMGWPGGGFCEGQTEPLQEFDGTLPECLQNIDVNWISYIQENIEKLIIGEE
ncbi:MAG: hypothetical protein ACXADW_02925 [Candidatus Hodarchaeales archaeon]|jgi:hypothetical protein